MLSGWALLHAECCGGATSLPIRRPARPSFDQQIAPVQPVVQLFKAAFLAEQMLRSAVSQPHGYGGALRTKGRPEVNLTSLLVLHALATHSPGKDARRGPAQSASQIAQKLGSPRPRVSMELRQLMARRWVDPTGDNRQTRTYVLTDQGVEAAMAADALLAEVSTAVRQRIKAGGTRTRVLKALAEELATDSGRCSS